MSIGRKEWAIAEGYIPSGSFSEARNLTSHELFCVLNTGDADAHLEVLLFFSDRDPVGPYRLKVPSRRSVHFRFNDLKDPEPVPFDTPYASLISVGRTRRGPAHAAGFARPAHLRVFDGCIFLARGRIVSISADGRSHPRWPLPWNDPGNGNTLCVRSQSARRSSQSARFSLFSAFATMSPSLNRIPLRIVAQSFLLRRRNSRSIPKCLNSSF